MSRYGMAEEVISATLLEVCNATVRAIEYEMESKDPTDDEIRDTDEFIDQARDAANRLIEMAGYDNEDSDHFGKPMGDTVQSLLMVAMMRCPQLAERVLGYADDVSIITDEN